MTRRAGPRRLLHRLGHAGRRGSLPHVRRHLRSLPRPRDPRRSRARAPRDEGARARLLPRRHARGHPRRGAPRARRVARRARGAGRLRRRRPARDVDAHADVRRRRARRRVRQRAVAADAGGVPHAAPDARAVEGRARCSTARGTTSSSTASSRSRRGATTTSRSRASATRATSRSSTATTRSSQGTLHAVAAGRRASRRSTCPSLARHVRARQHRPVAKRARRSSIVAGSTDKEHVHLPGGHVGAVVSRSASKRLWPVIDRFFAAQDKPEKKPSRRQINA